MNKYTLIEKQMPVAYERGDWDGKRSDLLVLKLTNNKYAIGRLYSGFMDGSYFNDWVDADDYTLDGEVIGWFELPL